VKPLPGGEGDLLIRTDFTAQQVWDDLLAVIDHHVTEGLLHTLRIVDDRAYEGMTAERLLGLLPDDAGCAYLALADARTTAPQDRIRDRTLLIVNVDPDEEDHGATFRARVSEFASVDANLTLANTEFGDYLDKVGDDGVYLGRRKPADHPGAPRTEGRPVLTEMTPGDTLRLGSLTSRSGTFVLVNQDDGDVVIYRVHDGATVWRTGTPLEGELAGLSNRLVLQTGGDLVLFAPTGTPVWSSETRGRDVRRAVLEDDGRLVLVGADGTEVWSSEPPH
jgi:hypothetical protein